MIVASNGMLTGGRVVEPPAQPDRRPDARRSCSSATRARGPSARTSRPAPARSSSTARSAGPLPGPLDQRLLGPRRRARAARLARRVRRGQAPRRPGLSAAGLPGPRRPGGPGRARAEGAGPGLRDPRPALARTSDARLIGGADGTEIRRRASISADSGTVFMASSGERRDVGQRAGRLFVASFRGIRPGARWRSIRPGHHLFRGSCTTVGTRTMERRGASGATWKALESPCRTIARAVGMKERGCVPA